MTIQTSLFNAPIPASRLHDSRPSILAEDNLNASGGMAKQRTQCYLAVVDFPNKTALELSVLTGINRYVLSRRLPELIKLGLLKRGELRNCTVNGNLMGTWEAIK